MPALLMLGRRNLLFWLGAGLGAAAALSSHPDSYPWHSISTQAKAHTTLLTALTAEPRQRQMLWKKKISQAPVEKAALVPSVPEIKQFTESVVFFPRTNMYDRRSPDLLAHCELWAISPFTVSIHLSINHQAH